MPAHEACDAGADIGKVSQNDAPERGMPAPHNAGSATIAIVAERHIGDTV
jgi:hypothetical protein